VFVWGGDQFGSLTVGIKKPTHLGVAAARNGEGARTAHNAAASSLA
jgi:hypothetical protein